LSTVTETLVAVTMPQMGVSVTDGTIVEWKVEPGDRVEVDQSVCEISTDKVETDVRAPAGGTVLDIVVPVDKTVPVGTVLAHIGTSNPAPGATAVADREPTSKRIDRRSTPVVRRIAETHRIDLTQVSGSGRNGRVTKRDIVAFMERTTSAGQPLSRMRTSIAEHMTRSLHTAAHCHTFIEVDMTSVESARAALSLSPLPLVARATVDALRAHPSLNAWLDGDMRTLHSDVHLGIAVSLGEEGLIVPVVHDAQNLSVEGLAVEIAELARRARSRSLSPDDVRGATFTITSLGAYGTFMSTPIINQPQVGILDLEAIVKRPVVLGDAIAIRPMTVLGLGWDHRALDGALAAQFLATLRDKLESWH
jgi:pyruvate/2-oxoglutarate dehydrogenase complex dihydrolipoamide acyltransferase (E2) component